jgi:phosphoribosyl 1,2-cyclic phosphodiesterase
MTGPWRRALHLDLLVVTHIDNDHIDGIPKLLAEGQLLPTFGPGSSLLVELS